MTTDQFFVNSIIYACLFGLMVISVNYSFAQSETSEQVTLSGDLANNPVAQDILKKNRADKKVD